MHSQRLAERLTAFLAVRPFGILLEMREICKQGISAYETSLSDRWLASRVARLLAASVDGACRGALFAQQGLDARRGLGACPVALVDDVVADVSLLVDEVGLGELRCPPRVRDFPLFIHQHGQAGTLAKKFAYLAPAFVLADGEQREIPLTRITCSQRLETRHLIDARRTPGC